MAGTTDARSTVLRIEDTQARVSDHRVGVAAR